MSILLEVFELNLGLRPIPPTPVSTEDLQKQERAEQLKKIHAASMLKATRIRAARAKEKRIKEFKQFFAPLQQCTVTEVCVSLKWSGTKALQAFNDLKELGIVTVTKKGRTVTARRIQCLH